MSNMLLTVRGLNTYYGASHVLRNLDFQVERGQAVGLMGRNGMGKSTLLKSIMGLVKPRSGQIQFQGQTIQGETPYAIANQGMAYVPEGRGIFGNLSVHENLVMAARPVPASGRGWSLERVLQTFPRLTERIGNLGSQLSGGEQQMLSIGRALMTQPELIILDEATEGLAPLIVAEIWRVIGTIREDGIATLIVDRDYRKVLAQSDRALVLQKGQVVLACHSAELRNSPQLSSYLGV
jgi:branched-chain amino acid transport system ATP-binding protein